MIKITNICRKKSTWWATEIQSEVKDKNCKVKNIYKVGVGYQIATKQVKPRFKNLETKNYIMEHQNNCDKRKN